MRADSKFTNYLYDGDEPRLFEEVDSGGNVVAHYTQGLTIDESFAQLRSGATAYYAADGLGSITSLTSASGSCVEIRRVNR
jgi:hypothetical protein